VKSLMIKQPYKATGTAGHTIEEWIEMSPLQQAQAHLIVMQDTARKWAGVQWRESMGVPATVPADAQTLLRLCDAALTAIKNGDQSATLFAMRAAAQAAELNRWAAIDKALALHKNAHTPRSSGGKATAERRKNQAQSMCEKIASLYLAMESKDVRDRTGVIATRLGIDQSTVRRHLKKAGLR
jgi:hypothetical protein